jgi:hypothetical protein
MTHRVAPSNAFHFLRVKRTRGANDFRAIPEQKMIQLNSGGDRHSSVVTVHTVC